MGEFERAFNSACKNQEKKVKPKLNLRGFFPSYLYENLKSNFLRKAVLNKVS